MTRGDKQRKTLARRRQDYEKMIAKSGDWKGYRKPGSNKRRR